MRGNFPKSVLAVYQSIVDIASLLLRKYKESDIVKILENYSLSRK